MSYTTKEKFKLHMKRLYLSMVTINLLLVIGCAGTVEINPKNEVLRQQMEKIKIPHGAQRMLGGDAERAETLAYKIEHFRELLTERGWSVPPIYITTEAATIVDYPSCIPTVGGEIDNISMDDVIRMFCMNYGLTHSISNGVLLIDVNDDYERDDKPSHKVHFEHEMEMPGDDDFGLDNDT